MTKVNLDIVQKQLPRLIEDVVLGDHIIIMRGNEPVAQLLPISKSKPKPIFGSAKGLIRVADDFDDPLDDFAEYMNESTP